MEAGSDANWFVVWLMQIESMDQMYQAPYGGLQNLGGYPRGPL